MRTPVLSLIVLRLVWAHQGTRIGGCHLCVESIWLHMHIKPHAEPVQQLQNTTQMELKCLGMCDLGNEYYTT